MTAIETLISVLCGPDGKCCISGSDDDRRLIDSALAEIAYAAQQAAAGATLRSMIEGMSVSVDVSTGDHDAAHRYFGTVTEVMECQGDKHGVTLLVQDAEPNFTATPTAPATQQAGERVYAFRRKGLEDFCTCDEARYEELSNKPRLFETGVFYTAPQPSPAAQGDAIEHELAMLIRRIVSSARRNCQDESNVLKLANEAWAYLVRKGLVGSPLRDAGIESDVAPQAADSVLEDAAWMPLTPELLTAIESGDLGNRFWIAAHNNNEPQTGVYEWLQGRNPHGFNSDLGRYGASEITHVLPYKPPALPAASSPQARRKP